MRLKDKIVLITGASQGIGKSIALLFASEGAEIILASRSVEKLKKNVEEIKKQGGRGVAYELDITDEKRVKSCFKKISDQFGKLHILVNNAGIANPSLISETSLKVWNQTMDVNLTGAFLCSKEAFRLMKRQKGGHIIFISSRSGIWGTQKPSGYASYCSSKYGLMGLMEVLAKEGQAYNIQAKMICPGGVKTEMLKKSWPDRYHQAMDSREIAKIALYLAREESNLLNGQYLNIQKIN